MARQQDKFFRTAHAFHVRCDDRFTRSVQCIVFMITGGRIPSIKEMTTDEYELRSMCDIDAKNLRMSSNSWEK
jgi:hypothetical protein